MSVGGYEIGAMELQKEFRDLLCLAVVGDHVRWVVTGDDSAALGDWLITAAASRLTRVAGWAGQRRALTTNASLMQLLDAVSSGLDEQRASLAAAGT